MVTVRELADHVHATGVLGDERRELVDLRSLSSAGPTHVAFLREGRRRIHDGQSVHAGALLATGAVDGYTGSVIIVDDVQLAYQRTASLFHPAPTYAEHQHETALVDETALVGADVHIGPNVVIGAHAHIGDRATFLANVVIEAHVRIGEDSLIYPNVTIREACVIGRHVIVHPGAVIGADGFGLARDGSRWLKIPQLGRVVVGDNCEIGANTTIDRGALDDTVIESGVKIDNLVHIAHNVFLGEDVAIAAQTGISGSSRIGARTMIAGQVGVTGHVEIGEDSYLAAQAGIGKSLPARSNVTGSPAREFRRQREVEACAQQLPELLKKLKVQTRASSEEKPEHGS